jgi:hypothetical protein
MTRTAALHLTTAVAVEMRRADPKLGRWATPTSNSRPANCLVLRTRTPDTSAIEIRASRVATRPTPAAVVALAVVPVADLVAVPVGGTAAAPVMTMTTTMTTTTMTMMAATVPVPSVLASPARAPVRA